MANGQAKFMQGERKSADGETPVFRMFTPGAADRDKDRIVGTLRTENFEKNPVLYFDHGHLRGKFPVGTARVFQEGGEWLMEPRFSEVTEDARNTAGLVKDGTLRACSIAYSTLAARPNDFGGDDILDGELLEISIVGVPAYPDALRVKSAPMTDDDLKSLKQMATDVTELKAMFAKAFPAKEEAAAAEGEKEKPAEDTKKEPPADEKAKAASETKEEAVTEAAPPDERTKFFSRFRMK